MENNANVPAQACVGTYVSGPFAPRRTRVSWRGRLNRRSVPGVPIWRWHRLQPHLRSPRPSCTTFTHPYGGPAPSPGSRPRHSHSLAPCPGHPMGALAMTGRPARPSSLCSASTPRHRIPGAIPALRSCRLDSTWTTRASPCFPKKREERRVPLRQGSWGDRHPAQVGARHGGIHPLHRGCGCGQDSKAESPGLDGGVPSEDALPP